MLLHKGVKVMENVFWFFSEFFSFLEFLFLWISSPAHSCGVWVKAVWHHGVFQKAASLVTQRSKALRRTTDPGSIPRAVLQPARAGRPEHNWPGVVRLISSVFSDSTVTWSTVSEQSWHCCVVYRIYWANMAVTVATTTVKLSPLKNLKYKIQFDLFNTFFGYYMIPYVLFHSFDVFTIILQCRK
jgi:hypothetical protein